MLVALDRDTSQTKQGLALPINFSTQELIINQEPPWLWFTLPELGFPLLTDEYRRPIHLEIEEYMRRYVSNNQDWEKADDEHCCGIIYTEPTAQIREKIETILHTWGEEQLEEAGRGNKTEPRERKVVGATRVQRSKILKDINLENEVIFEMIRNPQEVGAVRIFEKHEFWDSTIGNDHTRHSHDSATIRTSQHGRSTMTPSETYLNKC